mgnify:CR=1 FL=1
MRAIIVRYQGAWQVRASLGLPKSLGETSLVLVTNSEKSAVKSCRKHDELGQITYRYVAL